MRDINRAFNYFPPLKQCLMVRFGVRRDERGSNVCANGTLINNKYTKASKQEQE